MTMSYWRVLLSILTLMISACAANSSGEAPEPVLSGQLSPSAAGLAAMSTELLDPATCEGVLGSPPDTHTLRLQSLTDTAKADDPQIDAMCSAVYQTSGPGDPFLTIALIKFNSDEPAAAHYELLKGVFVAEGYPISEVNSADEDLLDRLSALIDSEGIGRITVMRRSNWVLSLSIGPTIDDSLWTTDDAYVIGESILGRVGD